LSHNNVFYGKDDDLKKFKEDLKKRIKENDPPSYLKPIGEARLYFELHPDKVVTRKELGEEIEESWKNLSSTLQRLYEKGEIGKYKTSYHKTHWGKPKAIKEFKDKKENQIVTKQDEIEDFLDKDGHVFELKEILEEFDNNAKSTINSHLKQLERKGKVEHFVFEQLKLWGTPDNINKLKNKIQKEVKKIED
jgi:DNA-binding MarR family transcriptional regulator